MTKVDRAAILVLLSGLLLSACEGRPGTPTGPSSSAGDRIASAEIRLRPGATSSETQTLSWDCGLARRDEVSSSVGGWFFQSMTGPCLGQRSRLGDRSGITQVGSSAITASPTNLTSAVTGTAVRLDWNAVPEPVVSYRIEAGSGSGLSNVALLDTGTSATSVTAANVPNGVYYVRVRAVGADGIPGPPSNEVVVQVGLACALAPNAPSGLSAQVIGNQVNLSWIAASSGDPASAYLLEAGTGPGLSNIVVFNTGNAATTLGATAPNGLYFVRVRGVNGCGLGGPSNEAAVAVGLPPVPDEPRPPTPTPPTPTPPTPTPPTPTPPTPTPPQEYSASISGAADCNVVPGATCPLEAQVDAGMPSPHTYTWSIGPTVVATGKTWIPAWIPFACSLRFGGNLVPVEVSVRVTHPGGSFATARKTITLNLSRLGCAQRVPDIARIDKRHVLVAERSR
jgi:hypothetical protein